MHFDIAPACYDENFKQTLARNETERNCSCSQVRSLNFVPSPQALNITSESITRSDADFLKYISLQGYVLHLLHT